MAAAKKPVAKKVETKKPTAKAKKPGEEYSFLSHFQKS